MEQRRRTLDNFLTSFLDALQLAESFDEKMEKALESLVVRNGFESGHLFLFEPIGKRVYHCFTLETGSGRKLLEVTPDSGLFEVIRKACADIRESVTVEEYAWEDLSPDLRPLHGSLDGIEANSVLLPLRKGEELIGAIKLVGQPGSPPPDRERRAFLDLVGRQMGKELAREAVLLREEALVRERRVLMEIGKVITSGLNLEEAFTHILHMSMQQTDVRGCGVLLMDEEGKLETVFGSKTESAPILSARASKLDPGFFGGVTEIILEKRAPVYVEDARSDPRTNNETAKMLDMVSILGVPMILHGKAIGFISLYELGQRHFFSEEDIRIMEGIAAFAAIAIDNARLYQESRDQRERRADLMLRLAQTQEEERSRISRELHDSMAQTLLEIVYRAESILGRDDVDERVEAGLRGILSSSRSSLTELRRIITDLRPSSVEVLGLPQALQNLLERFAVTYHIKVEAEIDLDPGLRLGSFYENSLYRMVREMLSYIARDAGASRVDFILRKEESSLYLWVSDDGPGVDLSSPASDGLRQGLVVMREKAETMGGALEISIEPGKGGTLSLRVPLPETEGR